MRKLKLQVQMSINGFIAGPNGEMDWMMWDWDDDLKDHVWNLHEPVDTILLGRKMAKGFIDTWTSLANNPETSERFARKMVETPKIVFSRSGAEIEGENTELRHGNLADEINKIKNSDGADIIVYGGAEFVGSLVKDNLIDEYHLFVNPSVLAKGMTIFDSLEKNLSLKLESSKAFDCGIVALVYKMS
jgi:dihydrofolate reductase